MPKFASKNAKIFQDMQCICRIHFTGEGSEIRANRDITYRFIQFRAASILIPVQLELEARFELEYCTASGVLNYVRGLGLKGLLRVR